MCPNTTTEKKISSIDKLKSAVYEMDCLSQCGFDEISAVARLALIALESPRAYQNLEHIAQAFVVILNRADDFMNSINCEAEKVGKNYKDEQGRARSAAYRAYQDKQSPVEVQS